MVGRFWGEATETGVLTAPGGGTAVGAGGDVQRDEIQDWPVGFRIGLNLCRKHARIWRVGGFALGAVNTERLTNP